jgi:hypothetical protein
MLEEQSGAERALAMESGSPVSDPAKEFPESPFHCTRQKLSTAPSAEFRFSNYSGQKKTFLWHRPAHPADRAMAEHLKSKLMDNKLIGALLSEGASINRKEILMLEF